MYLSAERSSSGQVLVPLPTLEYTIEEGCLNSIHLNPGTRPTPSTHDYTMPMKPCEYLANSSCHRRVIKNSQYLQTSHARPHPASRIVHSASAPTSQTVTLTSPCHKPLQSTTRKAPARYKPPQSAYLSTSLDSLPHSQCLPSPSSSPSPTETPPTTLTK